MGKTRKKSSSPAVLRGKGRPKSCRRNDEPCLLTFMQITDVHVGTKDNEPVHTRLKAAVKLANSLKVELLIDTGDVATNPVHAATEKHFRQLTKYRKYMAELHMPYYVVPGNHDIGYFDNDKDPRNISLADGDILSARFQKEIGPLDQSFSVRNFRFILANNNPPYGKQPGYLCERQLAWIRHELQRATVLGQTPLLFLHVQVLEHSTKRPWGASARKLVKLIRQFRIPLVTYGHVHETYRLERDGTCYFMCLDLKVKGHQTAFVYHFYETYFELWEYDVLSGKGSLADTYPLKPRSPKRTVG